MEAITTKLPKFSRNYEIIIKISIPVFPVVSKIVLIINIFQGIILELEIPVS